MRKLSFLAVFALAAAAFGDGATTQPAGSPLVGTVKNIDGKDVDLSTYKGKVVLVVNTASKCGFTPQYAALEKVYQANKEKGFVVLGFPANDFKQEGGTDIAIKEFCTGKYNVTFDMFSKVNVKGPEQAPLYKALTSKESDPKFAGDVKWNFTKFLIGKDGAVAARFESKVKPDSDEVTKAIEAELAK